MASTSYLDDILGGIPDGGGGGGGDTVSVGPDPSDLGSDDAGSVAGSDVAPASSSVTASIKSVLQKGLVWIAVGVILGIALLATVIGLAFRSIDAKLKADQIDQPTANGKKQTAVIGALAGGAALAAVVIIVSKLVLKWKL